MGKNFIMRLIQVGLLALLILHLVHCESDSESDTDSIEDSVEDAKCINNLGPTVKSLHEKIPKEKLIGKSNSRKKKPHKKKILFYLYKRNFPTCAKEIRLDDDSLQNSGFDASHPTRIIINGWMSSTRNLFIQSVSSAYFSIKDYNIIVVDWSSISNSLNYIKVAKQIDKVGAKVADLARHLHKQLQVDYDDIYLIGHSLGAHVAGSAGKNLHPDEFNTIFALDPAGPLFRSKGVDGRIDSSDAKYVESIQTSETLGFVEPLGHATFYPNKGSNQNCPGEDLECSHKLAYIYFAESINSTVGFWGVLCDREQMKKECPEGLKQYKMGGEPSTPKVGIFYVKTNSKKPYARGKDDSYL